MAIIPELHKKYVKGTEKGAIVQLVQVLVCNLTVATAKGVKCPCNKVYITTRVLKHIYDKRPAEEYDFLTSNVGSIVKFPDKIYRNKDGKRGEYCFIKEIKNKKCLCSLEITEKEDGVSVCEIVTFFRINDSYLDNYELLWEWSGGNTHRSAFDSGLTQPSSTPQ